MLCRKQRRVHPEVKSVNCDDTTNNQKCLLEQTGDHRNDDAVVDALVNLPDRVAENFDGFLGETGETGETFLSDGKQNDSLVRLYID